MSATKQRLPANLVSLVSVTDRSGQVFYDPARQPVMHARQSSQRALVRAQAERTNQVFREAVGAPAAHSPFFERLRAAIQSFRRELAQ